MTWRKMRRMINMKSSPGLWATNGRTGSLVFLGRRICSGPGYLTALWSVGDAAKRFAISRINFHA